MSCNNYRCGIWYTIIVSHLICMILSIWWIHYWLITNSSFSSNFVIVRIAWVYCKSYRNACLIWYIKWNLFQTSGILKICFASVKDVKAGHGSEVMLLPVYVHIPISTASVGRKTPYLSQMYLLWLWQFIFNIYAITYLFSKYI